MGSSSTSYIIRTTNESSVVSVIPVLWNVLMPLELLLLLAAGSFLAPSKEPSSIRHLSDGQIQLRQSDIKEISSYCFFPLAAGFHSVLPFFHSRIQLFRPLLLSQSSADLHSSCFWKHKLQSLRSLIWVQVSAWLLQKIQTFAFTNVYN